MGGEHGEAAVFLWSTVRVIGKPLAEYEIESGVELDKVQVEKSVKRVSRDIIRVLGGTMLGPACAFRDIINSVALDKREILPVAAPYYTEGVSQAVHVSIPRKVGWSLGATLEDSLTREEVEGLRNAARAIHGTYEEALQSLKE